MQIAIQEDMLPGRTTLERLQTAQRLGFAGVEFCAAGLTERVPEIANGLEATGLAAAAVHMGGQDGYISADLAQRETAIAALRQAMADAIDIGAPGVCFVPHWGPIDLPDLTPYKEPGQLAGELTIWLLRTVSDLAYAIGVDLYMLPVNRYETGFITRLDQAVAFRRKIKDHPHVKLAANSFHMALEEPRVEDALREYAADIGYMQLADSNRRLPGQGLLDFAALGTALIDGQYDGWLTLESQRPFTNDQREAVRLSGLIPAAMETLAQAGLR